MRSADWRGRALRAASSAAHSQPLNSKRETWCAQQRAETSCCVREETIEAGVLSHDMPVQAAQLYCALRRPVAASWCVVAPLVAGPAGAARPWCSWRRRAHCCTAGTGTRAGAM